MTQTSAGSLFGYSATLIDAFPTIECGLVQLTGAHNGPAPQELTAAYRSEQAAVAEMLTEQPIAELPSVRAWRRAFSAFGVKPTQHRVAVEALLRRLSKVGDIPSINTLVDIGNLVSIRHQMPVAVFDQRSVTGSTTVRHADGDERFTDLGSSDPVHPELGEVVFVDDAGLVSARRWCWRQSAQSATNADTVEALVTIEGHHESAPEDVAAALGDLLGLLAEHQPGAQTVSWVLNRHHPAADRPPGESSE